MDYRDGVKLSCSLFRWVRSAIWGQALAWRRIMSLTAAVAAIKHANLAQNPVLLFCVSFPTVMRQIQCITCHAVGKISSCYDLSSWESWRGFTGTGSPFLVHSSIACFDSGVKCCTEVSSVVIMGFKNGSLLFWD